MTGARSTMDIPVTGKHGGTDYYAALVLLASFCVYVLTVSPSVTAGDSGELAAAACLLGIPHPPGYPVYSMAGRLFQFIPLGDAAFRLNVASAFFSAAGLAVIYLAACIGGRRSAAAAGVVLLAGFTRLYWSQATYAEVYPLQMFISITAVYAALRSVRETDIRYGYLCMLLAGLSAGAHYAGLLFLPPLAVYLLYSYKGFLNIRQCFISLFFFFIGLSSFLYLPVRAAAGPRINWGDPSSLSRMVAHLLRTRYGDLAEFDPASVLGGMGNVLAVSAAAAIILVGLAYVNHKKRFIEPASGAAWATGIAVGGVLVYYALHISPVQAEGFIETADSPKRVFIAVAALAGVWAAYKEDRRTALLLVSLQLVLVVVPMVKMPAGDTLSMTAIGGKLFVGLLAVQCLSAAYFVRWSMGRAARVSWMPSYVPFAMTCVALALPVSAAAMNYVKEDRSADWFAHDMSAGVLEGMDERAVYLVDGDNRIFLTAYQQMVEMRRPDISVYDDGGYIYSRISSASGLFTGGQRPVYTSNTDGGQLYPGLVLADKGLVKMLPYAYGVRDPWLYYRVRVDAPSAKHGRHKERELVADYYVAKGRRLLADGDAAGAGESFSMAMDAGYDQIWVSLAVASEYAVAGDHEKADAPLKRALGISPENPVTNMLMGYHCLDTGDYANAEQYFRKAIKWAGNLPEAHSGLASALAIKGDYRGAASELGEALRLTPAGETAGLRQRMYEMERRADNAD